MGPLELILEKWSRMRGWYPVTMGGKRYQCDPNHISFWSRVNKGSWEQQTFKILDQLIKPDAVYCDIGAWIGPTVLFAAQKAKQVYCFEPDRMAYMYLLQNIKLNHLENVLPFNVALADDAGLKKMASPRGKRGDSMTSLLLAENNNAMDVLCLKWQGWLELVANPKIDCLKMDVEGGEFSLLPSMKNYLASIKPGMYLSLHPHLILESERQPLMELLLDALDCYGSYLGEDNMRHELKTLLEPSRLKQGSSILLLPE